MLDAQGRVIDYLRISVTDRCDLRCVYCMPEEGVAPLCHTDVLRYEEIERLARVFAELGVKKIRLTGGEPLVRPGIAGLVASLKKIDGIEIVALTTNGTLLKEALPELARAGLDAVNISIDTADPEVYKMITRRGDVRRVLDSIEAAIAVPGLRVKLNCVPTEANRSQLAHLARLAEGWGVPLRFIELMPIGQGKSLRPLSEAEVIAVLEAELGPLTRKPDPDPREKCRYYLKQGSWVKIGFISAVSHKFCSGCDRIRLTADGFLKTCLQYDAGVSLKPLLSGSDAELREAITRAVWEKPLSHHFGDGGCESDETRGMSQIGG